MLFNHRYKVYSPEPAEPVSENTTETTKPERDYPNFEILIESGIIQDSERNLRSKIDSIISSIENLSRKQARIKFELERQRTSLTHKRNELKRHRKVYKARVSAAILDSKMTESLQREVDILETSDRTVLLESDQVL